MPDSRIIIGAMSGTSADGIDVAVTQITGRGLEMAAKLLHHHARPYDRALRDRIFAIRCAGAVPLAELAKLGRDVSLAYAAAVNEALREANLKSTDVAAVCAHGQTLFHEVPNTIQWLDPSLLAAETGCDVVSDFRRADLAAGGQGAPVVPFADYILFRHPTKNRLVVNIGGIANATILPADCHFDGVFAYDTGPGNCVSDHLMRKFDPTGPGYDADGAIAMRGKPIRAVVEGFLSDDYFTIHLSPLRPKSTDIPAMIDLFDRARAQWAADDELADLLATACLCCTRAIQDATRFFGQQPSYEVIISGGGDRNACMMSQLNHLLNKGSIVSTDVFGVPSVAKEALAFALLGAATLDGLPSNVPSVTGAKRPVVLGSITPKP